MGEIEYGTYKSEDKNFTIKIIKARAKDGVIEAEYKTNYSPMGPFTVKGNIGKFSWVYSEERGKQGVAPFNIRFMASDRPEPGRSYCIYDTWTGAYTVDHRVVMEGARSYVNSTGIVETKNLGTLTFSQ